MRNYVKDGHKVCPRCKENKEVDAFGKRARGGYHSWCHQCRKDAAKEWTKNKPEGYDRNANLKSKFGITSADYNSMVSAQGGVCAICGLTNGDKLLVVDHCHTSGKVRELLCSGCNTGLGMFRENTQALINAIAYINKHKENANGAGLASN